MTCYGPLVGFYSKELNPSGSRGIVFSKHLSFSGVPLRIRCGECIGCRKDWAQLEWTTRCMHEKQLHRESSFVTLTYDDAHLPSHGSLKVRDLQLFMKRLRHERPSGLRFFACGEYGNRFKRPHYHILLFNTDFADRKYYAQSPSGSDLFRSAELAKLWPQGRHYIGLVTPKSVAYVAGYVLKKVGSREDYGPHREPEFRVMSRRPGIGFEWFQRFGADAFRHDNVVVGGMLKRIPRYYDAKFRVNHEEEWHEIKLKRRAKYMANREEHSRDRMAVKELLELRKAEFFKRGGLTDG